MVLYSCLNLPGIKGGFEIGHRMRFCENACVCTVFLNSAFKLHSLHTHKCSKITYFLKLFRSNATQVERPT